MILEIGMVVLCILGTILWIKHARLVKRLTKELSRTSGMKLESIVMSEIKNDLEYETLLDVKAMMLVICSIGYEKQFVECRKKLEVTVKGKHPEGWALLDKKLAELKESE